MHRPAALSLLALHLAGCSKEPSFGQRYEQQATQIERRASDMQRDLDRRMAASNLVDAGMTDQEATGADRVPASQP